MLEAIADELHGDFGAGLGRGANVVPGQGYLQGPGVGFTAGLRAALGMLALEGIDTTAVGDGVGVEGQLVTGLRVSVGRKEYLDGIVQPDVVFAGTGLGDEAQEVGFVAAEGQAALARRILGERVIVGEDGMTLEV